MQTLHNYPVVPYDQTHAFVEKAPKPNRGLSQGIYKVVDELGGARLADIYKYLPALGFETTQKKVKTCCRNLLYTGQLQDRNGVLHIPSLAHYNARQEWLTLNTNTAGANRAKYDREKNKKKNGNGAAKDEPITFRPKRVTVAPKVEEQRSMPHEYAIALAFSAFSGGLILGTALGFIIGGM